jgi:hypothetical protein
MRLVAASEVRELFANYDSLLAEINNWRSLYNPGGIQQLQARPANNALLDLLKVDQEVFGTFPGGFGDNGTGDEHDEDQGGTTDDRVQQCDADIEIPNANTLTLFPESDPVTPCGPVEANPSFNQLVPISRHNVPSGNSRSNLPYSLPTEKEDNMGTTPWNHYTAILDDEFLGSLGGPNILQSRTTPSALVFSAVETGQSSSKNTSSLSYEQDTPAIEYTTHQYQPYKIESQPNFHAEATNQLSLTYATTPNYTIEDMTT